MGMMETRIIIHVFVLVEMKAALGAILLTLFSHDSSDDESSDSLISDVSSSTDDSVHDNRDKQYHRINESDNHAKWHDK